jgi:hypothetical protein
MVCWNSLFVTVRVYMITFRQGDPDKATIETQVLDASSQVPLVRPLGRLYSLVSYHGLVYCFLPSGLTLAPQTPFPSKLAKSHNFSTRSLWCCEIASLAKFVRPNFSSVGLMNRRFFYIFSRVIIAEFKATTTEPCGL